MKKHADEQFLDNNILNLFSNVFYHLNVTSSDIKKEYRELILPKLSDFERTKILSIEGLPYIEDKTELLTSNPIGQLVYKGRPVILFIRDQMLSIDKYTKKDYNPFHVCNCSALKDARLQNRFKGRYAITYNTSGIFHINISAFEIINGRKNTYPNLESLDVKLKVCQSCLKELNWNNFNNYIGNEPEWWRGGDYYKRKDIVDNFNIRRFFEECHENFLLYEDYSDLDYAASITQKTRTLPPEIKSYLKKTRNYICEICHKAFPENKLQIHHINHNEGNNLRSNLLVICDKCHDDLHSKEDFIKIEEIESHTASDFLSSISNNTILENVNDVVENESNLLKLANDFYCGNNVEKAIEIYNIVSNLGNAKAMFRLAEIYNKAKNYDKSIVFLKKSAKLNFPKAQYCLAHCYKEGNGIIKSSKEYAHWLKKSADNGYIKAECEFAYNLELTRQYSKAFNYYKNAADKDYPAAQYEIGRYYYLGLVKKVDFNEAFLYFKKAARHDFVDAIYKIATCYENGQGIAQDYNKAFENYKNAALKGHSRSQYKMAYFYQLGLGVDKNMSEAYKWYKIAESNGDMDASRAIERINYYKDKYKDDSYSRFLNFTLSNSDNF